MPRGSQQCLFVLPGLRALGMCKRSVKGACQYAAIYRRYIGLSQVQSQELFVLLMRALLNKEVAVIGVSASHTCGKQACTCNPVWSSGPDGKQHCALE